MFAGTTFRIAFDLASIGLDLHNQPDWQAPVFLTAPHLGGTALVYTESVPDIETALLAYLNTPFRERYQLVYKGDTLAETMSLYYRDQLQSPVSRVVVVAKRQIGRTVWHVQARVEASGVSSHHHYHTRVDGRSVQVDWEATVGHWSMPVKTYLAMGSSEPVVARVRAELGTFYHGPFSDQGRQFQSVRLRANRL